MQVIATAGHVDHGKSTLVRLLTGMEPDRLAAERRRGLTIELGYAWATLPSGRTVAFVDVPGHARFVPTMLAGVGPVPAVLFVVAADEGWMPQSAEHLDALAALGVGHGVLAINRCDRADPAAARTEAAERLAGTPLAGMPAVAVSGATGDGLDALRDALDALAGRLPTPAADADVRLWIDRAFHIRGAGVVVTGTLPAGTVRLGDELLLAPAMTPVRVRGMQALGRPVESAAGTARVALNLRGVELGALRRGTALLSPGGWRTASVFDVRLLRAAESLSRQVQVHLGAASLPGRLRRLGPDTARLSVDAGLPLRIGDRLLLRDPGAHRIVAGAVVLDAAPPPLPARRGAAAARGRELAGLSGVPDEAAELARRGLVRAGELRALGVPVTTRPVAGDWLADPGHWARLREALRSAVAEHRAGAPLVPGLPVAAACRRLNLPDPALVTALADGYLTLREGRLLPPDGVPRLPPTVARAVAAVRAELAAAPYAAPDADRLAELGLGRRELAAAVRAGELVQVAPGVVLRPDAAAGAADKLAGLPQPFTVSQARRVLDTSRRVAVPLLEHLDRLGYTERLADSRRRLRAAPPDG